MWVCEGVTSDRQWERGRPEAGKNLSTRGQRVALGFWIERGQRAILGAWIERGQRATLGAWIERGWR